MKKPNEDILIATERLQALLRELHNCECFRGTRHEQRVENELEVASEAISAERERRKQSYQNAVAGII